jgi:Protein of unknown function (DUF3102)
MPARPTDSLFAKELLSSQEQTSQATVLADNAASIRQLSKRVIGDVIEIGHRLSDCKRLLGHGSWLPWLEREFSWSERTARNFISAYEFAQSKSANIADLGIDVSSLYLLAAPSTPEKARVEVLRRAEAGDAPPRAEVKHIIEEARGLPVAVGSVTRRISVKDAIEGLRLSDFAALPSVEQAKILDERPKNVALAIADATTRQRWKPPYRHLQDALDALEATAKSSTNKIVAAIPIDDVVATPARIERAIKFLVKLGVKLRPAKNESKSSLASDATILDKSIAKARKTNSKKYGRTNPAQVIETIWSELNPAQIGLLRGGRYGPAIKAIAERLDVARKLK